jgi:hypothetical protein
MTTRSRRLTVVQEVPMSALGQTRTLDNVRVTSAKLLIADSKQTFSYVRSGPLPEVRGAS